MLTNHIFTCQQKISINQHIQSTRYICVSNMDFQYNNQQEQIKLTEYGRGVQDMVEHLKLEKDKEKRNILAHTIFQVMVNLNPDIKSQSNYQQTVWDHMHEIANYELDIDNEYPTPTRDIRSTNPDPITYKGVLSKYRYYGRNLLEMIVGASKMDEGELKSMYINYIASFMVNSSKNWNDEVLTPQQIVQHLADLSNGDLHVDPNTLAIHVETRTKRPNHQNRGHKKKKNYNSKFKKK
jgi:hypothetical protein